MGPPPARTLCPTPPAPAQVVVEGRASSAELHNLSPRTEYLVSVVPVYQAGVGEGLPGGRGWPRAKSCRGVPPAAPLGA